MRYVGQGSEIVVTLPNIPFGLDGQAVLRQGFETAYAKQYNRIVPGSAIEIISFGVTVLAPMSFHDPQGVEGTAYKAEPARIAQSFDADRAALIDVPLYRREDLKPGAPDRRPGADFRGADHGRGILALRRADQQVRPYRAAIAARRRRGA